MKIGTITFWESKDNYGQLLQVFALQEFLRKQGHEPFLIRYHEEQYISTGFSFRRIGTYIRHFKAYFQYCTRKYRIMKYNSTVKNTDREFDKFLSNYVTVSERIYSEQDLYDDCPKADAYICGSDQIWGGRLPYYLPFVPDGAPKIAYAPSFGGTNPFVGENAGEVIRLLKRFDFIGTREKTGTDLIKEHGLNAEQVVDPTLLLDADDYDRIAEPSGSKKAFVYLLGNPIVCPTKDIFDFIARKGLDYTYVASQGQVDDYEKSLLSIPRWIDAVRNAELVITNSFHCTVFSLIYNRPFIIVPLGGTFSRMNDRFYDLLGKVGMSNRILTNSFDDIPLNPDFSQFNEYRRMNAQRAMDIFSKYGEKTDSDN